MVSIRSFITYKDSGSNGDTRTMLYCLLRAVTSEDGMTADYFSFQQNL